MGWDEMHEIKLKWAEKHELTENVKCVRLTYDMCETWQGCN